MVRFRESLSSKRKGFQYLYFFSLLILLVAFLFTPLLNENIDRICAESKISYAKVVGSNVKLYRTTSGSEEFSNVYFVIPQSYFVILGKSDDENYYSATYIDVTGYVKKNEVQCVSGTPVTPFASAVSFRIFIPGGVDLRSGPTQSEGLNSITTLQYLETNLKYYGAIDGEEAISYKSTKWYYCKYYKNGIAQSGYVYAAFCDLLPSINENTETLEYIDSVDFDVVEASTESPTELTSLPNVTQIIIIVAVSLPCIFIIYLLFKPTKITARVMEDSELKPKKTKKKVKHRDYYEYEDS